MLQRHVGLLVVLAVSWTTPLIGAGRTRLIEAAKENDARAVRTLLQRDDAGVDATEADGATALHWAVYRDNLSVVAMLLDAGAKATAVNRYGVTPLSLACSNGSPAIVERLLAEGADPNAATAGGETPLMTAARTGGADVVGLLVANGADVDAHEATRGQTALMWAAAEGHVAALRALLEAGADLHAVSHGPPRPEAAAGFGAYRASVPRLDSFTPLLFAVQAGHIDAVRTLVGAGANVNDTAPDDTSALVIAITNRHYELAATLLELGADPNAAKQGWGALHQLARTRTLNTGVFPHPVATGGLGSLDLAQKLLELGADVNLRMTKGIQDGFRNRFDQIGATPFLLAAKGADAEMMRVLADNGADTLATTVKGTTALMVAAGVEMFQPNEDSGTNEEALEAVKVALSLGLAAEVTAVNDDGDSALHGAAYRGSNEIVQLLVDHGATLDAKNKSGFTPLRYANGEGGQVLNIQRRPETVALLRQLLIDRGLAPEMKSDEELYSFGVEVK